jgi:carbamoyltransferase
MKEFGGSMKIVGYQSGHDVSYCILEDGVPIIHEELERFLREKEPLGDGLEFALNNISDDELDEIKYFTEGNPFDRSGKYGPICSKEIPYSKMKNHVREKNGGHYIVSHHQSHASNAFFSSNHDDALIITIDGGGNEKQDWKDIHSEYSRSGLETSFTVWLGSGNKIQPLKIYNHTYINLGCFYQSITKQIYNLSIGHPYGFQGGTVMAMACMGNPDKEIPSWGGSYFDLFYGMLRGKNTRAGFDSRIHDNKLNDLRQLNGDYNKDEKELFDVAAGAQKALETRAREIITPYVEEYKPKNICLSGGVVLNSVMVGKMYDWYSDIEDIYVCPIPYDAGLAIGSAQYIYHQVMDKPRVKWSDNSSPYLGRTYDEKSVWSDLDKVSEKLKIKIVDDEVVARLLSVDNNVISVFGGGSESGRRALGNRSILADPRSPEMKDIINEKVKHRQWFRPFAPSITREDVKDWFEKDVNSPYMTAVIRFKEEMRDKVPAVVHFDGTARLQTVTENDNEWYYNFIKKFESVSGVPILLNTSFNDREPIVETPEHAINCFLRTNIDYLYFREFGILVSKNG